jgi:hypothetical protein
MTDEMRQARINQNLMKKEGTGWDVGYGKAVLFLICYRSNMLTAHSYSIPRE